MIIFGSRMYGVKNVVHGFGLCPHCNQYAPHKSYNGRRWGHIYFIPIIPETKPLRVLKECSRCNTGSHIEEQQIPTLHQQLHAELQACIAAAQQGGRTEFDHPEGGEPVAIAPFLADAIEMLYAAGFGHEIEPLLDQLDQEPTRFEHSVAAAAHAEVRGDPRAALELLNTAADVRPDAPYPPYALAGLHHRIGDPSTAVLYYQQACDLTEDDPQILLEMTGPLEQLERYEEVIAILNQCIQRVPELEKDKAFMKQYRKLQKKAEKSTH